MAIIGMSNESSSPSSAETGDTIYCEFVLANNSQYTRMAWYSISDYSSGREVRLITDEFLLSGYSSIRITKTLSMPSHDLVLKFHTGYVGENGWVMTDESVRPTITHEVSDGAVYVRACDDITGDYLYATVYLDYLPKGTTIGSSGLLISNVPPGFHTLYLEASGYHSKTVNIYVQAGRTTTEDVDMDPIPREGSLEIRSDPSGASAFVNGLLVGQTPVIVTRDAGTYNVHVKKDGYHDSSTVPAYVEADTTRTVTFVLMPLDGRLTVESIPVSGAAITINGTPMEVTPHTFDLAQGPYTVGIEKAGYITPQPMSAMVLSDRTTLLRFTLDPEPPKPIICLPSIAGFSAPDGIDITFPPAGQPAPPLFYESVPVTFAASMSCTQDGNSRTETFPFYAKLSVMGSTATVPVHAGTNEIDISDGISAALSAGLITPDTPTVLVALEYPTRIEDGVVTAETTINLLIHVHVIVHPMICLPSIPGMSVPDILLKPPTIPGGLPTLDTVLDPVTFAASMSCTQGEIPVGDQFPFYVELFMLGSTLGTYIPVHAGTNEIDITAGITSAISSGTIAIDTPSVPIAIRYPTRIEDGVITEYATIDGTIGITVIELPDIFCDLAVTASDPGVIPFDIPTVGALPTLAVPIPITATFSAVCDNGAPADLLTYINAEVRVNDMVTDILPGTIRPNSAGIVCFDLATDTNWLSSIAPGATTMELKIGFPRQLKCTTPTPYGGTQYYTKPIRIEVTRPPAPGPVICIPSIPAGTVTHPPNIQLSTPLTEGGLPTLDPVSAPVTFDASMSCSQDGVDAGVTFPFYAEFYVAGTAEEDKAADITVYSGANTIQIAALTSYINAAIARGDIAIATTSLNIYLVYPTKIENGVPGDYTTIAKTINITPPWVPGPTICLPSIPAGTVTHPPNIQLSTPLTEGGLPTLDPVSAPVTFDASMSCSQDGVDAGVTFPFYAEFYVAGTAEEDKAADITVYSGANTIQIAALTSYINAAIARGDIAIGTTSLNIYLVHPTKITDGIPGDYTTIAKTINITPPEEPPAPTVCNITNVVEKEPLIVTISDLGIPTVDPCDIDVQLYITPPCGKSMAEILAVTGSYLSLNHADGTPFASIPLNIYGEGVLDIASYARNWLLTITEIPTSLNLVLVCPSKVTFSTPVAEYEDVPILVGIEVHEPEIPVCEEGTFTSPFICPDGSMIYLLKCVNGELVDSGQTCPVVPPECVLDASDLFTCPDGTVIQLNECVNGVKVPIVPTPTCPPVVTPPPTPPPTVARAMVMAIPNTVPEGRTVDIVVQALCAGVESDGEDATLLVDDAAVMTRPTKAGEVSFRWVATEIGTRMVCVSIPANPACPYPGAVCRSIKVVTYLPEVKEQVELEMSEYETDLAELRAIRELERERLRGVAVSPGMVRIPSSLAGSTVVIGGIPRVVPPGGISITVPAGEEIVTIIKEGVREIVPVLILPGETETLPWSS